MSSECNQCSTKFNLLKRKHACDACAQLHCSDCLSKFFYKGGTVPSPHQTSSASGESFQNSFMSSWNNFSHNFVYASNPSQSKRYCHKCTVFAAWPVDVTHISNLRVRDLRFYLARHAVSCNTVTEKGEMVALVVNQIRRYRGEVGTAKRRPSARAGPTRNTDNRDSVIRDDGIRVSPGAHTSRPTSPPTSTHDDNIRVFSSELNPESPTNSSEESFVVIDHSEASSSVPQHSNDQQMDIDEPQNTEATPLLDANDNASEVAVAEVPAAPVVTNPLVSTQAELSTVRLDQLTSEEDVRALGVRACRVLLAKHRVSVSGVIEKEHLTNRVLMLWQSYTTNAANVETLPDSMLCKICFEAAIDCVLLECGHMVACVMCGRQLSVCPVCREHVRRVVHTFLA